MQMSLSDTIHHVCCSILYIMRCKRCSTWMQYCLPTAQAVTYTFQVSARLQLICYWNVTSLVKKWWFSFVHKLTNSLGHEEQTGKAVLKRILNSLPEILDRMAEIMQIANQYVDQICLWNIEESLKMSNFHLFYVNISKLRTSILAAAYISNIITQTLTRYLYV